MEHNQSMLEMIDQDGIKQFVEVVFVYEDQMTKQQYIVYTKNEKRENDMVILYASKVKVQDEKATFENISDEEWKMLKEKMRDAIHGERGNIL